MECLKPATELKLVSRGNEFQAFTTRSLKKLDLFSPSSTAAFIGYKFGKKSLNDEAASPAVGHKGSKYFTSK